MNRWQGAVVPRKTGRPPHSQKTVDAARPRVLEVLQTIGYQAGWPTVKSHLEDVPTRVIQMLLRVLKLEHRSEMAKQRQMQCEHTEYLAQGVLVGQDSTHVGGCRGRKVHAEVQKDAATTEGRALGDGKPLTADKVIAILEAMEKAGTLPLAYGTDNGSGYTALRVKAWLESRQVVHLLSRPHTPQDNGRTERAIGEGKALAGLGRGVQLETTGLGVQILDHALQTLNNKWPRRTKGGLTAAQLKVVLPHWQSTTSRSEFYEATCSAIRAIKADNKRALRKETRKAIFRTLEQFGLILRTRGERKSGYVKQDTIS